MSIDDTPTGLRRQADAQLIALAYRVTTLESELRGLREDMQHNTHVTESHAEALNEIKDAIVVKKAVKVLVRFVISIAGFVVALKAFGVDVDALWRAVTK